MISRSCERSPRRWQPGYPGPRRNPGPVVTPPVAPTPTDRPAPIKLLVETFEGDPSPFVGGGWT